MRLIPRASVAAVVAVLAVPAAASAATPSVSSVRAHVRAADHALVQLKSAVRHHHRAAAIKALHKTRSEVGVAAHQARALHARSHTSAARAFSLVAGQYNGDLSAISSLIPSSSGSLLGALTQALAPVINGRTQALGFLGSLVPSLSSSDQTSASQTIGDVVSSGPGQVQTLAGDVQLSGLSDQISQMLSQALTAATGFIDAGLAQLQNLIPNLPQDAQQPLQDALTQVTQALDQVMQTLQSVIPQIADALGSIGNVLASQLSQLSGIFGQIAGAGAGSVSSCGFQIPLPSFLSGLLGHFAGGSSFFGGLSHASVRSSSSGGTTTTTASCGDSGSGSTSPSGLSWFPFL